MCVCVCVCCVLLIKTDYFLSKQNIFYSIKNIFLCHVTKLTKSSLSFVCNPPQHACGTSSAILILNE